MAASRPLVKDGLHRFTPVLAELRLLAEKSLKSKSPAAFLYESGARSHLFKAEALSRIYRKANSKKIFNPLYAEFKSAEDALGEIDQYSAFLKSFSALKAPAPLLVWLKKKYEASVAA